MNLVQRCVPVLALLAVVGTTGAGVPNRTLTLDPPSGAPRAQVTAAGELGAECADAQSVSVRLDGAVIASRLTFTVPDGASPGAHSVSVTCNFTDGVDSATLSGRAGFTVVPDPVRPDPVNPNPDPVNPNPVNPGPVDPGPVNPNPVNPGPVDPGPVNPNPVNPGPVDPGPVNPNPVNPGPVDLGPVDLGPVNPGPVEPGPVDPGPVDPEPGPSALLAGLACLALVGLDVLVRHVARRRPGRSEDHPARISVVPLAGPVSSPTLQNSEDAPRVDVRVVLRPDPGELTLRDR